MDNDLMARRLRPPSEPSRPSSASALHYIPAPSALPWETETRSPAAARDEIPWDAPAAEAWPPDPAIEEAAVASWPSIPAPTEAAEPVPQAPEAAQTDFEAAQTELDDLKPAQVDATSAEQSVSWQPAIDSPLDADSTAMTDPAAAAEAPMAPEAPWDRPSNDDFDQPMDVNAGGPSWDEPSAFDFDDDGIFDDRPPEMLEALHNPVAVAVQERPVEAVGTTLVDADAAVDAPAADAPAGDPYDEAAPVVADVAERLTVPAWPSWNGHDTANGHDTGNGNESANGLADESLVEMSAIGQDETSTPELSSFVPWDESPADDADEATTAEFTSSMPTLVVPESVDGGVATTSLEDLFASPPVSEDELPEPDDVAPWDSDSGNDGPELENVQSAPVAEEDPFDAWQAMAVAAVTDEAEPATELDTPNETADFAGTDAAFADTDAADTDAADSEAEAVSADPDAPAESEPEAEASVDAPPEASVDGPAEAETATVPIEIPAPSAFPATIYASGPESGLPANVVLRIELSIVDDAKRLNVTNVASASEFAPRADDPVPAPAEPSPASNDPALAQADHAPALAEDSAWPAIWDPDRDSTGFAAPDAQTPSASEAWAWPDPSAADPTFESATPSESWPEVDRVQDPFGDSPALATAVPLVAAGATPSIAAVPKASPRISTIAEPQSDLWFLSGEPETPADAEATEAAEKLDKPGMSLLTVGVTILMAILVVVLVLAFIWLLTSLLG